MADVTNYARLTSWREIRAAIRAGQRIQAISLRQPWAWAVIEAGKDVENRDWKSAYRGPLVIHAATYGLDHARGGPDSFIGEHRNYLTLQRANPGAHATPPADLRYGGFIGIVDMIDCVSSSSSPWYMGAWAFVLANPRPLPFVRARGYPGFFPVEPASLPA